MVNITDQAYVLYERLASAKLNALLSQINSHNHGLSGGVEIDTDGIGDGSITGAKIAGGSVSTTHIVDKTITNLDIADSTITPTQLNLTSIHLVDGYAVYAP